MEQLRIPMVASGACGSTGLLGGRYLSGELTSRATLRRGGVWKVEDLERREPSRQLHPKDGADPERKKPPCWALSKEVTKQEKTSLP